MALTRQDLITLVLENLGVLAAGQSASIEDRDTVNRRIDVKLAELGKREVMAGLNADALDDGVFLYVADVIGYACRVPFGITGAKADLLAKAASDAEAMLKAMARQYSTTAAADAFDVVRDVLERLGVVAPGQDPSAQDRGVVSARIVPMLADLKARDITTFLALTDADPAMLPHLATILVSRCAPAFGADAATQAALGKDAATAEGLLNALVRQFDTGVATSGTFDVIQAVLENLGAVAVGRTATAKDRAIVSGRVTAVLDDLRNREVIDLLSLVGANASTLLPLSVVLTSACAMAFGVPADVRQGLRAEAELAEAALRRQTRQLDSGTGTSGTFDVIQASLEALRVVGPGQSATAKDRAVVSARVSSVLADLRLREVIDLPSLAGADPGTLIPLEHVLALACAPSFPIPVADLVPLKAVADQAEAALKRIARQLDVGTATSTVFDPVQAALEMIGVVSAGQSASEKDRAVVHARVQPLLMSLRGRDICGVSDLSDLSIELQSAFAKLLAAECAASFSDVPPSRVVWLESKVPAAEQALRYQSFVYDARPPIKIERFWGYRRGWVC